MLRPLKGMSGMAAWRDLLHLGMRNSHVGNLLWNTVSSTNSRVRLVTQDVLVQNS